MGRKSDFDLGLASNIYGPGYEGREILERYGVEGAQYNHPDGRGGPTRHIADVKRDLSTAMMNDYHTNESFQNAALAGDKKAKKFAKKGFNENNIHKGWDAYRHLNEKYADNDEMLGSENISTLTYKTGLLKNEEKQEEEETKSEIDGEAGLDNDTEDSNSDEPTEAELAQQRINNYERKLAPDYFNIDGRKGLEFRTSRDNDNDETNESNSVDNARAFRDNFRNKLVRGY